MRALALALLVLGGSHQATAAAGKPADPLAALGIAVSRGAAPGYVASSACRVCHREIFDSYQRVGMARSFFRPSPERDIEDFTAAPFEHVASHRRLAITRVGGRLVFRRWQVAPDGSRLNEIEIPIDWVLGSGHFARTYLYRTPSGELFQLPLAWYSQERRWGMAPGYDRPDHQGVLRRVRRECMVCHDAYPELAAGADTAGAAQRFPADLLEGTGCQRCHGPGAEHVRAALDPRTPAERLRSTIVNPRRLPPARRDDVCNQCHLQPAVVLPGVRRFGRGDYAFRPGQALGDQLVLVDPIEAGRARDARFEIDHHGYRLRQSRCFQQSGGRLACITCHDPHRRVAPAERVAHFRAACLTCHRAEQCPTQRATAAAPTDASNADCTACHMPKRRTQDVVHVVMTDHRIARLPPSGDLVAPLPEREPEIAAVELLAPVREASQEAPQGSLAEIYRAVATLRAIATPAATDHLAALLGTGGEAEPRLDLGRAQVQLGRFAAAEQTLGALHGGPPLERAALRLLALAASGQGQTDRAIALLRRALREEPDDAETRYNLGRLLAARGHRGEAITELERAVAGRPNLAIAWSWLGRLQLAAGQRTAGESSLRSALAWDPSLTPAYAALIGALLTDRDRGAAQRYLAVGAESAGDPRALAPLAAAAEAPHR
ncbi:MAG: tetratricopeptide repeat protein [Acidobacteriota bacterium]